MPTAHNPSDRTLVREGLILTAFLALCGLSVWLVVLPELEDHENGGPEAAALASDAGVER